MRQRQLNLQEAVRGMPDLTLRLLIFSFHDDAPPGPLQTCSIVATP
jgi:hypothetical protein